MAVSTQAPTPGLELPRGKRTWHFEAHPSHLICWSVGHLSVTSNIPSTAPAESPPSPGGRPIRLPCPCRSPAGHPPCTTRPVPLPQATPTRRLQGPTKATALIPKASQKKGSRRQRAGCQHGHRPECDETQPAPPAPLLTPRSRPPGPRGTRYPPRNPPVHSRVGPTTAPAARTFWAPPHPRASLRPSNAARPDPVGS